MRAHLVQLDTKWEDKPANHSRVLRLLESASPSAGDLIVLPEMFDTGFSLNVDVTHDTDRLTERFVRDLARNSRCTVHGARTVRTEKGKGRNRASVADADGTLICEYDKVHPFSFGREPERFEGGESVRVYEWRAPGDALIVCPAICYDIRFPELFRAGIDRGASLFAIGANWPAPRAQHWRALAIARAIENQSWVLGVNRAGHDPYLEYAGGSLVVDPSGNVISEAGIHEHVLSVTIDSARVESWRAQFPALADRRCPVYRSWDAATERHVQ